MILEDNEIKDLQRDLRKLKKLHEDTTKEVNEFKHAAMAKQSQSPETTQSLLPAQATNPPHNRESLHPLLIEVSVTLQLANTYISLNVGHTFTLLETECLSQIQFSAKPRLLKRHKYLPHCGTDEKDEQDDFVSPSSVSKSFQNVLSMSKMKLHETMSLLHHALVSVCSYIDRFHPP